MDWLIHSCGRNNSKTKTKQKSNPKKSKQASKQSKATTIASMHHGLNPYFIYFVIVPVERHLCFTITRTDKATDSTHSLDYLYLRWKRIVLSLIQIVHLKWKDKNFSASTTLRWWSCKTPIFSTLTLTLRKSNRKTVIKYSLQQLS